MAFYYEKKIYTNIDARDGREWDALLRARTRNPAAHSERCYSSATHSNNYLGIAVTIIRRTSDQGSLIIWHRMSRGTVAVSVLDWFCMILYQIALSYYGSRAAAVIC